MTDSRTSNLEVELDLLLDEVLYGNSYYKMVDGQKVRIAPWDVYIRPPRWVRLWYWLRSVLNV